MLPSNAILTIRIWLVFHGDMPVFLGGDHDSYYWICRWLADGSIIVTDIGGKYYHVTDCGEKKYIGCHFPAEEGEKCLAAMERLAKRAREIRNMAESEKMEKRGGSFWKSRARLFRSVQG